MRTTKNSKKIASNYMNSSKLEKIDNKKIFSPGNIVITTLNNNNIQIEQNDYSEEGLIKNLNDNKKFNEEEEYNIDMINQKYINNNINEEDEESSKEKKEEEYNYNEENSDNNNDKFNNNVEYINNEYINEIENNNENSLRLQLDEDMKIYKDKFNFVYKPNQRFLEEELLVYDIYRRRIEAIMNNNNLLLRNNKKRLLASYMPISMINNRNLNSLKDTQDYLSKFTSINLDQNDSLIYKSIFDNNPLNINQKVLSNFENKLKNDPKFAQKIIDKMFSEYFRSPTIFYEFNNIEQFNRLAQILISVCLNKEIYNKLFELNYGIINIAEKGFII
jgi:hypothetical protein